jgi:hypothetical protein
MDTNARALFFAGFGTLLLACTPPGGRGPDPALSSNAAVTPGGSELGVSGTSNDLRPGERAPTSRPNATPRGIAVDAIPPRGPALNGPTESTPPRPPSVPASALTVPSTAPNSLTTPPGPRAH